MEQKSKAGSSLKIIPEYYAWCKQKDEHIFKRIQQICPSFRVKSFLFFDQILGVSQKNPIIYICTYKSRDDERCIPDQELYEKLSKKQFKNLFFKIRVRNKDNKKIYSDNLEDATKIQISDTFNLQLSLEEDSTSILAIKNSEQQSSAIGIIEKINAHIQKIMNNFDFIFKDIYTEEEHKLKSVEGRLTENIKKCEHEIQRQKHEKQELQRNLSELNLKIKQQEGLIIREKKQSTEKIESCLKEIEKGKQDYLNAEQHASKLSTEIERRGKQLTLLNNNLQTKAEEHKRLLLIHENSKEKNQKLQNSLNQNEKQKESLQASINKCESEKQKLMQENTNYQKNIEELKIKEHQAKEQVDKSKNQAERTKIETDKQLQNLREQLRKQQTLANQNKNRGWGQPVTTYSNNANYSNSQNLNSYDSNNAIRNNLGEATLQIKKLTQEGDNQRQRIKFLEEENNRLKNSQPLKIQSNGYVNSYNNNVNPPKVLLPPIFKNEEPQNQDISLATRESLREKYYNDIENNIKELRSLDSNNMKNKSLPWMIITNLKRPLFDQILIELGAKLQLFETKYFITEDIPIQKYQKILFLNFSEKSKYNSKFECNSIEKLSQSIKNTLIVIEIVTTCSGYYEKELNCHKITRFELPVEVKNQNEVLIKRGFFGGSENELEKIIKQIKRY